MSFNAAGSSRARRLLTQLIEVDKVINRVGGESIESVHEDASSIISAGSIGATSSVASSSSKKKTATATKVREKNDMTELDGGFMKPQMSFCPKCYAELKLGSLRRHMAEECANNDVCCPEHDCNAIFSADQLKQHLAVECIGTKRRKALVEQSKVRKEREKEQLRLMHETLDKSKDITNVPVVSTLDDELSFSFEMDKKNIEIAPPQSPEEKVITKFPCESCGYFIEGNNMSQHMISTCPMRLIYCPNVEGGCQMKVSYALLENHIKHECVVEKFKNELIAKAALRCAPVKCIGCGKTFQIKNLSKHESNECVNRKVPCRNAHLGCTTMVRSKDRARHEEVDGKSKIRYCLYLSGEGSYLDLSEDDLRCPWTAEFMIYRISAREATKQHLRNLLELTPLFIDAFRMEHTWRIQVEELTQSLKNKSLSIPARDEIMSILADTVEAFEDAAVATTEIETALKCCIASAKGTMTEFLGPKFTLINERKDSERGKAIMEELMCLKRYEPGHLPPVSETKTISRPGTTSRPSTKGTSRPGSSSVEEGDFQPLPEWQCPHAVPQISAIGILVGDARELAFASQKAQDEEMSLEDNPQVLAIPPPTAFFLMTALKTNERGQGGVGFITKESLTKTFSWPEWCDIVHLYNTCLSNDLKTLHNLRISGRILKEDKDRHELFEDDESIASSKKVTEEEIAEKEAKKQKQKELEEKLKKKEKEKKRREMKRNKGKKELIQNAEDEENAKEDEEEEEEERTPEEIEEEKRKAARERKRATREKLIPRLDDARKACSGRDILFYSTSSNKRGAMNKICLDMSYPGEENMEMKKGQTWLEGQGGGQVGVVSADTVLGGSDRLSFGKSVPREKWVHLSFVATKEPLNKIIFYMDGLLVGQVKDCAFPLPMSCLAGAPTLSAFSGCLLDTRIWTKQRSQMEIRGTMNKLIELDGPMEPPTPDYDLTAKGLVGWWTYEDGRAEVDEVAKDVSEHRAPTALIHKLIKREYDFDHNSLFLSNAAAQSIIKAANGYNPIGVSQHLGRYWNWVNADDLPLPFEKELAAGQDRPLPVPAFSAIGLCQYELHRLRLAQKGRLLQRQINCPLGCDAFILKKDLRFHVMFLCEQRHAKCRFDPVCKITFPEHERQHHEEEVCAHIKSRNEKIVRFNDQNILNACPKCSTSVRKRDQENHDMNACPHRVIKCPHKDCEESLQAHNLKYHLKFECESDEVQTRHILIQRARERSNYVRDWLGQDWGEVIEYDIPRNTELVKKEEGAGRAPPSNDTNDNTEDMLARQQPQEDEEKVVIGESEDSKRLNNL